jgi:hypothetical protein
VAGGADERSRVLGGALALGAIVAGLLFLFGVLRGSYLALAVPVTVATLFVLGLVAWIGWTIATVQVDAEGDPLDEATPRSSAHDAAESDAPRPGDPGRPAD